MHNWIRLCRDADVSGCHRSLDICGCYFLFLEDVLYRFHLVLQKDKTMSALQNTEY